MNRILVVEDEQAIADMVKLCLSKNGYICEAACDGLTAIQKIEEKRYDLILLDIMLPDYSGYELIEYIKPFDIPADMRKLFKELKNEGKTILLASLNPMDIDELCDTVCEMEAGVMTMIR